jgi:integrase
MKLTKGAVAALTTDKPDHVFWDDELPGFGVRLRGATKRWLIQYRAGLQQRRESLGDVRKVPLDDARRIARQRFAQIELGADPAADREAARAAAAKVALTLGTVSNRYLEAKRGVVRPRTYRESVRYFAVHWASLRGRPVASVTRADIAAELQIIRKAHGQVAASRARAYLSAMFSWAMGEAMIDANPVIGTNDPGDGIKPRERVLSDAELKLVWNAAGDGDFGRIVKLLILCGARRQEIGSAQWCDIDFDSGVLTIPADRAKNHHALELPLPPAALEILRSTPRRGVCVFGSKGTGFTSWSVSIKALYRRLAEQLMAPWTLHDLRRSYRTALGRLGVPPHVAELLIDHTKSGIEATYDRYSYAGEKARALALWADHILAVVEGRTGVVVPLRA